MAEELCPRKDLSYGWEFRQPADARRDRASRLRYAAVPPFERCSHTANRASVRHCGQIDTSPESVERCGSNTGRFNGVSLASGTPGRQ